MECYGYEIRFARASGGKAGRGCNKTSTVQVFDPMDLLVKQFRFEVDSVASRKTAMEKAHEYVLKQAAKDPAQKP